MLSVSDIERHAKRRWKRVASNPGFMALIQEALRQTLCDIFTRGPHRAVLTEHTLTTEDGVREYPAPYRMMFISDTGIQDVTNQRELDLLNYLDAYRQAENLATDSGAPEGIYVTEGGEIGVHPIPGGAYDIALLYYKQPTANSIGSLADWWEEAVMAGVDFRIARYGEDETQASMEKLQKLYEDSVHRARHADARGRKVRFAIPGWTVYNSMVGVNES